MNAIYLRALAARLERSAYQHEIDAGVFASADHRADLQRLASHLRLDAETLRRYAGRSKTGRRASSDTIGPRP